MFPNPRSMYSCKKLRLLKSERFVSDDRLYYYYRTLPVLFQLYICITGSSARLKLIIQSGKAKKIHLLFSSVFPNSQSFTKA